MNKRYFRRYWRTVGIFIFWLFLVAYAFGVAKESLNSLNISICLFVLICMEYILGYVQDKRVIRSNQRKMDDRLRKKETELMRIKTRLILIGVAGSLACLNGCGSREVPTEAVVENITPIESITPTESITSAEKVTEEMLHIASDPYSLSEGTEYRLYLPETEKEGLPEDFLSRYPGWNFADADGNLPDTLSCFGIYNVKMGYGFFAY